MKGYVMIDILGRNPFGGLQLSYRVTGEVETSDVVEACLQIVGNQFQSVLGVATEYAKQLDRLHNRNGHDSPMSILETMMMEELER